MSDTNTVRNPNCRSGCKTQDHADYGDCLQAANFGFAGCFPTRQGWDKDKEKRDNKEIESYWAATKQGIEPRSTRQHDIDKAVQISNEAGKAFDGTNLAFKD